LCCGIATRGETLQEDHLLSTSTTTTSTVTADTNSIAMIDPTRKPEIVGLECKESALDEETEDEEVKINCVGGVRQGYDGDSDCWDTEDDDNDNDDEQDEEEK
jgi:hypothetical protein